MHTTCRQPQSHVVVMHITASLHAVDVSEAYHRTPMTNRLRVQHISAACFWDHLDRELAARLAEVDLLPRGRSWTWFGLSKFDEDLPLYHSSKEIWMPDMVV